MHHVNANVNLDLNRGCLSREHHQEGYSGVWEPPLVDLDILSITKSLEF